MGDIVDQFTGVSQEKKAAEASRAARGRGMSELNPESIMKLVSMLQSPMFQLMASQIGTAQAGLAGAAGRKGAQGAGVISQLMAGIPGQVGSNALQSAIAAALPIIGKRADIASGVDPVPRSTLQGMLDTGAQFYGLSR